MELQANPYTSELLFLIERNLNSIVAIFLGLLTVIVNIIIFKSQIKHNIKVIKQESINRYNIDIKQKWIDEIINNISLLIATMKRLSLIIKEIQFRLDNEKKSPNDKIKTASQQDLDDFKEIDKLLFEYRRLEIIVKFNLITYDEENQTIVNCLDEYYDLVGQLTNKLTPNDKITSLNEQLTSLHDKLIDSIHKLILKNRDSILK